LEYTGQTSTGKDLKKDNDKMDEDMDEESGGDYSDDSNELDYDTLGL
ncbi:9733_t:CDS:2, partial [Entrophospora sp. SA101]